LTFDKARFIDEIVRSAHEWIFSTHMRKFLFKGYETMVIKRNDGTQTQSEKDEDSGGFYQIIM
jgi:hypothetical protein